MKKMKLLAVNGKSLRLGSLSGISDERIVVLELLKKTCIIT